MDQEHSSKSSVYSETVDEILITAFTFFTIRHTIYFHYRRFFELTCAYKIVEVSETMCTNVSAVEYKRLGEKRGN